MPFVGFLYSGHLVGGEQYALGKCCLVEHCCIEKWLCFCRPHNSKPADMVSE